MRLRMRADARRERTASAGRAPGERVNLLSLPSRAIQPASPIARNVAQYWMPPLESAVGEAGWRDMTAEVSRRIMHDTPLSDASIGACEGFLGPARSVLPVKPDQLALNLHPVRRQDADFIGRIGRLERNRSAAAAEAF